MIFDDDDFAVYDIDEDQNNHCHPQFGNFPRSYLECLNPHVTIHLIFKEEVWNF